MIYFDNAATTHPKPEEVYRAQDTYLRDSANPGRGVHRLAVESARKIYAARIEAASFLGIKDPERLVFTGGCTQSLNMALKGLAWRPGDVVVTSPLEHNSVMRPLRQLEGRCGIKLVAAAYSEEEGVDLRDLESKIGQYRPRLCAVSHASNVTGHLIDLPAVAEICCRLSVPLLVDAAQAAGVVPSGLDHPGISLWAASGHKSLLGPPGVGLLYVAPEIELEPLVAGGTGSRSENLDMPEFYPDHLESGTLAGPAIAALGAGIAWLRAAGPDKVRQHELSLTGKFLDWAATEPAVRLYGPPSGAGRTAIVSFAVAGITADRVADLLDRDFGIAVRAGLHCAASAHETLGTAATGLVRASFGPFNTPAEVDQLCAALSRITAGAARR